MSLVQWLSPTRFFNAGFTNLHFDLIATAAAVGSLALGKKSGVFRGLQYFPLLTLMDRSIKGICVGDFKITCDRDMSLPAMLARAAGNAMIETAAYSGILLSEKNKGYLTGALRCTVAFVIGITASRALRHADPKAQDLWDAAIGLGWAAAREIVIQKATPHQAVVFSILTNSLVFGIIEGTKFSGSPSYISYKRISGALFRGLLDYSAISGKSIVPALTAHLLFDISRCFSS